MPRARRKGPHPCKRARAGDCVEAAEEVAVEKGVVEGAAGNLIRDADLQAALKAGHVGEYRFFAAGLESAGGAAIEGAALDTVIAEAGGTTIICELLEIFIEAV